MKIFHLELGKLGTGLSGGEKCMVEVIRYFRDQKIQNIFLTTDNGKELYEKLGLTEDPFLQYVIIDSFWTEQKFHLFVSFLTRPFLFSKIKSSVVDMIDRDNDILMCHSDFFPNTIPTSILRKYFSRDAYYWYHMQAPDVFKGYKGHFNNTFYFPNLRVIHYKLNQIIFKYLSRKDITITVNPYYKNLFKNRKVHILKNYGGEELNAIWNENTKDIESEECLYDLAFVGRFHEQKGLDEIPEILSELKKKKENVKLVMIGGGDTKLESDFFKKINERELADNVVYLGFISSDEKFRHLRQARVFLFPSYYESFGQVALEAMSQGLPVVAYDLPVYNVFEKGMIKVPLMDNKKYAEEVWRLMSDNAHYSKISNDALAHAKNNTWTNTGKEVLDLILA